MDPTVTDRPELAGGAGTGPTHLTHLGRRVADVLAWDRRRQTVAVVSADELRGWNEVLAVSEYELRPEPAPAGDRPSVQDWRRKLLAKLARVVIAEDGELVRAG